MNKEPKYLVKFTNANNDNGTVWYHITVISSKENSLTWNFKERYSRMREIHQNCQKTHFKNQLPEFPPRRLFGNTKEEFIQKRKKQLENYYSTLFRVIDLEEFPQLLAFFNKNKPSPQKKPVSKPSNDEPTSSKIVNPANNEVKKQKQMKKVFEEIVSKIEGEMVESNDFENDIEDETRRKFNQEFQKLKLDLKSKILDSNDGLPKGEKENDAEYWSTFYADEHEDTVQKLRTICKEVGEIYKKEKHSEMKFVIAL